MSFERTRTWLRWLGGLAAALTLAPVFIGLWRGLGRPAGRSSGHPVTWLRRPAFYVAASVAYFGAGALLWRPMPRLLAPSPSRQRLALLLGALLYFPGLALALWGRLVLGPMYFVSTSRGAQLFKDHTLITHGPYAWVRHPMYLGLILASFGGLLIYQTWTWVLVALNYPALLRRARREEEALAAEFGAEWQVYAQRVPAGLPRPLW